MGFWGALGTAYRVAVTTRGAATAAHETIAQGGSPFAALRAFAEHTEGELDDAAVAALEAGLRKVLIGLEQATAAAA